MYKIGHRKRNIRHHVYVISLFVTIFVGVVAAGTFYISNTAEHPTIDQAIPVTRSFDPNNAKRNLKIDTDLYTMELPSDWKQISQNADTRYTSTKWEVQSGIKNRWIEVFTDRIPPDMAFNRIIPVVITGKTIARETTSDNCSKFTPKTSDAVLKVPSKWQYATFLCDLSNATDNIVGVADKSGTTLSLTGGVRGTHSYMFVYTDRGIPEDQTPISTALKTLIPK